MANFFAIRNVLHAFAKLTLAALGMAWLGASSSAAVYSPSRQLSAQLVADFKSSPAGLLQQYPAGGAAMIARVRDLAASDPATLPSLVALLKSTPIAESQLQAIIIGLAQVARMAAQSDPSFAVEIQAAIAATGDPEIIAAYRSATGDVPITSMSGGSVGSGGTSAPLQFTGGSSGGPIVFGTSAVTNQNAAPPVSGSAASAAASVSPR